MLPTSAMNEAPTTGSVTMRALRGPPPQQDLRWLQPPQAVTCTSFPSTFPRIKKISLSVSLFYFGFSFLLVMCIFNPFLLSTCGSWAGNKLQWRNCLSFPTTKCSLCSRIPGTPSQCPSGSEVSPSVPVKDPYLSLVNIPLKVLVEGKFPGPSQRT